MKLTIYFDGQFWVGVVEEVGEEGLRAARHVFGSEPLDGEVLDFVKGRMMPLLSRISGAVAVERPAEQPRNPKRAARESHRAVRGQGVSTHAQEALKAEIESRKTERALLSREEREQQAVRRRELSRSKAKERHRGH